MPKLKEGENMQVVLNALGLIFILLIYAIGAVLVSLLFAILPISLIRVMRHATKEGDGEE